MLPLAAVRVLDQTDEWGELASRLLGDLGADVIRVEPVGGSHSRYAAPVRKGISLGWVFRNGGKRVLELDTTQHGRSELDRLLTDTDVLVTSRPIDDDILDRFPNLVVLVITPYGLTGPYATWQATDAVIAATAAQAFKAGASDREPLPPPGRFCDHVASATAAFAVLCALRHRNVHGVRSVLDFSVNEAVAQMSDWSLPNGIARQQAGLPVESRHGSGPVYPVFRCRDGHVRLIILSPRQWHAMRAWLGEPDYLQDPDLDGFVERLQLSEAVLNPLYRTFFADRDMDAVCVEAQRRGIVCTPVYSAAEVLACDHLRARHTFVTAEIAPGLTPALHAGFFEIQGNRVGPSWTDPLPQPGETDPAAVKPPSLARSKDYAHTDPMPAALASSPSSIRAGWIVFRVLAAVVTVPIAEELAFRGFLLRRLATPQFETLPLTAFTWLGLAVSSLAFGLLHGHFWFVGTLAGLLYAWAMLRRGRIGEAVIAHATTNAFLACYVLLFHKWHLLS